MLCLQTHAIRCCALISLLFLTACGGRSVNKKLAQDLIADNPAAALRKEDITVESVSQTGQSAVVEAKIHTAFRLQRVEGKWIVREVRIGDQQWEKIEDLAAAVQKIKIEETRSILEQVAAAVERYHAQNGRNPSFKNYVSLSDTLYPTYLTPLIRLDAWRRPLEAFPVKASGVKLVSAGPDGKFGSADDIERTIE